MRPDEAGTVVAAVPDPHRAPRWVGLVWGLLLVNTLGYTQVDMLIPVPRPAVQVVTMGSLAVAFALALALNPRVRLRPNVYLLALSSIALVGLVAGLRLESGLGSLIRCARLVLFVATLWLLSRWWRGDLRFASFHLRALAAVLLSVLVGLVVSPPSAFSGPDGRLSGAVWPITSTQVGQYCAVAIGLAVLLWVGRRFDGRSVVIVVVPAAVMLLLSHTRTAAIGLAVALLLGCLSLALTEARARRTIVSLAGAAAVGWVLFGALVLDWLRRGQDAQELTSLTGRAKVWDLLLAKDRTLGEQLVGVGLTDKSFDGLPIDSSWLSIYNELGWIGIGLTVLYLVCFVGACALRPPSPERACAIFLVAYSLFASYTEVGLGDASPYLLHLAVAMSLLARPPGPEPAEVPAPPGVGRRMR